MLGTTITGSVTHEGVTTSSNHMSADEIRSSLGLPSPDDTPDETAETALPETPAASATPVADTATPERLPTLTTDQRASEAPTPKKKNPQARIDAVVREREDARREAVRVREESQAELARVRAEFQAQIDALQPKENPAPPPVPEGEPKLEDFADQPDPYAAHVRALAKYDLKQEMQAREQAAERARSEHETQQRQFAQEQQERERLASFGQKIAKAIEANPDLQAVFDAVGDLPISRPMADAMMESDAPERIAVYFQHHPEEAERIAALPAKSAFSAIVRLDARLDTAAPGSAPVKPKSQAHAPISPVGGAQAAPKSGPPDPHTCTQEEFDAYWNQLERDQRLAGRR